MKFYVYSYSLPGTQEPFYIGKGQGGRAWVHLEPAALVQNDPFHRYLNKLLQSSIIPIIEFIWQGDNETEALDYERSAISFWGRKCNGSGCLLNLTEGGDGVSGLVHSDETKKETKRRSIISE